METEEILLDYIHHWFMIYRPELDLRKNEAERIFKEIQQELNLDEVDKQFTQEIDGKVYSIEGAREAKYSMIREYLDEVYFSPTNQVCMEVAEEREFYHATEYMKDLGFLYYEEMEMFIEVVKKSEWYKEYEDTKELLTNEEFRNKIRQLFRDRKWNNFLPVREEEPFDPTIISAYPPRKD